jgi:hypothetical protein
MRILAPILLAIAMLAGCGQEDQVRLAQPAVATAAPEPASMRPQGVVVGCRSQSGYDFADAYTNPDNLVVGPLIITNAVYTEPGTIREFGGDKIFVLVRPGHRVTLALSRETFRVASLGYGPLPQNVGLTPRDGHRVVTFMPCSAERAWSSAGGKPVTFWSGFMLTDTFLCMPIDVWVDDQPEPHKVTLGMGVRDCSRTEQPSRRSQG